MSMNHRTIYIRMKIIQLDIYIMEYIIYMIKQELIITVFS